MENLTYFKYVKRLIKNKTVECREILEIELSLEGSEKEKIIDSISNK